jgi:hypothetical protein
MKPSEIAIIVLVCQPIVMSRIVTRMLRANIQAREQGSLANGSRPT